MGELRIQARDVYDDRPTPPREGGRDVAMDDHGTRKIPANWRWGYIGATFTSFGVSTAMIYLLSGALYAQAYGARAAIIGAVVTWIYAFVACFFVIRHVINEGISSDLLSRSTFGYMGSAYIAILYAVVCSFYFAAEGSVMASALHEAQPAVPYWGWAVITGASFVLVGMFGMVLLTKIQWATLVLYFVGLGAALWALFSGNDSRVSLDAMRAWSTYNPNNAPFDVWTVLQAVGGYIGVLGAILAVFNMDVARFIRREDRVVGRWVFNLVNVTFPVLIMYIVGIQMLAGSGQPDPGVSLVRLIGPFGLFITLITQVRINVLNMYGGTLGLANFFSRMFGFVPGRQFWVFPFLILATGIILTPFREYFPRITIYISVFLCAWVSTLVGERVLVRKRRGLPQYSEVRRSYLPRYNVIGMVSMWVPVAIACVMASGAFGVKALALAVPFSIVVPFFAPALVAACLSEERLLRAYIGRDLAPAPKEKDLLTCTVCKHEFHRSDFALCPYHKNGWICSYCCMSELRCETVCQTGDARISPVLLQIE